MKINRRGQAKVLSLEECELLFRAGFTCSRDQALFASCYYSACRMSEARQLRYDDVFDGTSVREFIILRKRTTKGQQATRKIPTHPRLATFLTQYRRDSKELFLIRKLVGYWGNLTSFYMPDKKQFSCLHAENRDPYQEFIDLCEAEKRQVYEVGGRRFDLHQKVKINDAPEIRDALIRLGVRSSSSYGCLYLHRDNPFLFPGMNGKGCLGAGPCYSILSKACKRLEIQGVSTHSYRRTALTEMYRKGFPLKTIQKISGHRSLAALQLYLEVTPDQLEDAISRLPSLRSLYLQESVC